MPNLVTVTEDVETPRPPTLWPLGDEYTRACAVASHHWDDVGQRHHQFVFRGDAHDVRCGHDASSAAHDQVTGEIAHQAWKNKWRCQRRGHAACETQIEKSKPWEATIEQRYAAEVAHDDEADDARLVHLMHALADTLVRAIAQMIRERRKQADGCGEHERKNPPRLSLDRPVIIVVESADQVDAHPNGIEGSE